MLVKGAPDIPVQDDSPGQLSVVWNYLSVHRLQRLQLINDDQLHFTLKLLDITFHSGCSRENDRAWTKYQFINRLQRESRVGESNSLIQGDIKLLLSHLAWSVYDNFKWYKIQSEIPWKYMDMLQDDPKRNME